MEKNKFSGTKTEKNLWEAFAGESQARNRYNYYASIAKKQGYEQIANFFAVTADNEKEHAKLWLKALNELGTTFCTPQRAKTTNGRICTIVWQRKPKKKALPSLPLNLEGLLR